jgi:hypothetical protein
MIKTIFIYWHSGFINAPDVVKKCLLSWKIKNIDWKIIELDDNNLCQYISKNDIDIELSSKNITKTSYSDIIRIILLYKYGGCWCDSTTFCMKSLDDWLENNIQNGFFAFDKPSNENLLSSWFIYSEKSNYITSEWKRETEKYWKENNETNEYFWFHNLFKKLYINDKKFKLLWDLTSKISANEPHYLQYYGLLNPINNNIKSHINNTNIPIYKLTYKYDVNKYNKDSVLYYLLSLI